MELTVTSVFKRLLLLTCGVCMFSFMYVNEMVPGAAVSVGSEEKKMPVFRLFQLFKRK